MTSTFPAFPRQWRKRLWWLMISLGLAAGASRTQGQSFALAGRYPVGIVQGQIDVRPYDLALHDLNGDGRLDLVTVNYQTGDAGVLLGQAGGSFAPVVTYSLGGLPNRVAVGDITGDGRPDMVVCVSGRGLGMLPALTGGGFGPVSFYLGTGFDVALGDVDGDGQLDAVTTGANSVVWVLRGQAGGLVPLASYATGGQNAFPTDVALGDVNGDGRLDIVTTNQNLNNVAVLLGQPGGTFAAANTYATQPNGVPRGVQLADVNSDGRLDIVVANQQALTVSVLLAQAGGGFAPAVHYATSALYYLTGVTLGDVTGDGRLDMVTANYGGQTIEVRPGLAAGGFAPGRLYPVAPSDTPINVALGDLNADGRLDIVSVNLYSSDASVLLNTGTYLTTATAQAGELQLYPNPARASFTVQLPTLTDAGPIRAELCEVRGAVVRSWELSATAVRQGAVVATADLPAGIYVLRLTTTHSSLTRRLLLH